MNCWGSSGRRALALLLAASPCLLAPGAGTATATAATPGAAWSIDAQSQPTSFGAAETHDSVKAFAVLATGGTYQLSTTGGEEPEALSAPIEWDETAAGLQAKLEAVPDIGPGDVTVSGGPGDELGSHPYSVTFTGSLSGRQMFLVPIDVLLTGGAQTVKEETAGSAPAGVADRYTVLATNTGSRPTGGTATVTVKVPAQLAVIAAEIRSRPADSSGSCSVAQTVVCQLEGPLAPGAKLVTSVSVALRSPTVSGTLVGEASVAGGGAQPASASMPVSVGSGPSPFGIQGFRFEAVGVDGRPDLQAGDHPYALNATIELNTIFADQASPQSPPYVAAEEAKAVALDLPLGLIGDPLAAERCPEHDMDVTTGPAESGVTICPPGSIVGEVWLEAGGEQWANGPYPLYDLVPESGYPAELGFNASGFGQPIFLYASLLPSEDGYRLRIAAPDVLRALKFDLEGITVSLFGVPGLHNGTGDQRAFASNPTECTDEPAESRLEVSSWPGHVASAEAIAYPQLSGCELLQGASAFDPTIALQPEQTQADSPAGYEVALKLPQAADLFAQAATPQLRDVSLTLPAGLSLSPALASGPDSLEGCTPAQIDLLGTEPGEGHPGGNGSFYDDGLPHASPGHCPDKSRIGDAELTTPLLEGPLHGHLYVATPTCGAAAQPACTARSAQNGELFAAYLELSGSGTILKLRGTIAADAKGQLTIGFDDAPQLPFEELRIVLYGGQRAPLANPQTCGAAIATGEAVPWSAPGSPPSRLRISPYEVSGCADPMPFAPHFTAGTAPALAGEYATFATQLSRGDGEQDFAGASVSLPSGLVGLTANVARCQEPQASSGDCPQASRIGTARVAAGAGSEPLWLEGPVYLTGPYEGSPFGVTISIRAQAGPFDLGDEVVRARLDVDPRTARVTVTTDTLPLVRDGIPFRLKMLQIAIDRRGFILNPTHCDGQLISGDARGQLPDGSPGESYPVSAPFAVAGCGQLPFKPSFTVSTHGATSKANGASLDVKVVTPAGSADVREVHVTLPKQLPARLETLKLACVDRVFDRDPAACPRASAVGVATAQTPILARRMYGPAYLVSHGGAEFPDLEIVLQGEGVELILDGKTFVHGDVTTSTFSTLPDAPVRSFELTLPQGPHSVLGAPGGKLCSERLAMPTAMKGQNGAAFDNRIGVAVSGCKPAIEVLGYSVEDSTATIRVRVPSAGVLAASAPGLSRAHGRVGHSRRLALRLSLARAEHAFLARHPGRRLQAHVVLRFRPRRGRLLTTGLTLLIG